MQCMRDLASAGRQAFLDLFQLDYCQYHGCSTDLVLKLERRANLIQSRHSALEVISLLHFSIDETLWFFILQMTTPSHIL